MKGGGCAGDLPEYVGGFCTPDECFWVAVAVVDVAADGSDQLLQVLEDAAPDLVLQSGRGRTVRSQLSSEADVGVKRTWNRLCFSNQRWTRGCLCVA